MARASNRRMFRAARVLSVASVAVGALLLNSCASKDDSPPSGSFRSVYQIANSSNCQLCHQAGGAAYGSGAGQTTLDISSASAYYSGLSSLNSTQTGCTGVRLVQPGAPATSMLIGMVASSQFSSGGCTPASHSATVANLSADEASSIKAWIAKGAPND